MLLRFRWFPQELFFANLLSCFPRSGGVRGRSAGHPWTLVMQNEVKGPQTRPIAFGNPGIWVPQEEPTPDRERSPFHTRSFAVAQEDGIAVKNLHRKVKFRPNRTRNLFAAVYQNLPLPLYWTVTCGIPSCRRAGVPAGAPGRRGIIWGVSDYGACRKRFDQAAKGNPNPVPICVTTFLEGRVVIRGI